MDDGKPNISPEIEKICREASTMRDADALKHIWRNVEPNQRRSVITYFENQYQEPQESTMIIEDNNNYL